MSRAKRREVVLRDGSRLSELVRPDEGVISARIWTDPELYQLELERIFLKVWVAVAHESEIAKPGDYVTRYIGEDPVIVTRSEKGDIHVLLNSCSHRGTEVCWSTMGNASHFRCPYHGFTYKNTGELTGVPALKEAFDERLDKSKHGLLSARTGVYGGVIFATWNPAAPSLEEQLGDMRWYLDLLLRRTGGGMEVIGVPQRWIVEANWKTGADNFIGDAYHTLMTHRSAIDLGTAPPDPNFGNYGYHVETGNGHGIGLIGAPPKIPLPPYVGLPQELWPHIERSLSVAQRELLAKSNFIHGNVFPNLSLLNVMLSTEEGAPPVPFLTLRLWIPKGPHKMEVLSWFLVEKEGPDWYKEASRKTYERTFGISGTFEQDDTAIWVSLTRASKGVFAQRNQRLLYGMGLDRKPLSKEEWNGPGNAYVGDFNEANQRALYRRWLELLTEEEGAAV